MPGSAGFCPVCGQSTKVFTTYLFSAMFIVLAAMLPMESAADRYLAVAGVQVVLFIYMITYIFIALRVCYGEGRLKTVLKFLGLAALFLPMLGGTIELASHVNS